MAIAIIGAGIAGLSAARRFAEAGETVRLYDKGRGPGGRLSTRRAQTPVGEVRWDHGAQYFTVRSKAFSEEVVRLRDEGAVSRWRPRLADIRKRPEGWTVGVRPSQDDREALFVGTPAMNAVIKALANGLDMAWGRRVTGLRRDGGSWRLDFEDGGSEGPFETVVCAVPAEQASVLLAGASPDLAAEAAGAHSAPCWAVMAAFDTPPRIAWDGANVSGGALAWAARDSSKPGRGAAEAWVLHASAEWSRANTDLDRDAAAARLVAEFRDITGLPEPAFAGAHRWLYAKVETAAGSLYGWDGSARIAAIGDWRSGPRVESAWLSGQALADDLAGVKQLEI